jgi:ERCC4-type nuclease
MPRGEWKTKHPRGADRDSPLPLKRATNVTLLISPAEPREIKGRFENVIESGICEERGADFIALIKKDAGTISVGIQRKLIPEDLMASIDDGRLNKELALMKNSFTIKVLMLEGMFLYNSEGMLSSAKSRFPYRFNRKAVRNLLRSVSLQFGVHVEFTDNHQDTCESIMDFVEYLGEKKHQSLYTRPGPSFEWNKPTLKDRALYWVQGFPGISVGRGEALFKHFSTPLALCNACKDELRDVDGIGKKTSEAIFDFLRAEVLDHQQE